MRCLICNSLCDDKLCKEHSQEYMWDSTINGYRFKKRTRGSRYTTHKYHKNEIKLTKILEDYYGQRDIVTSYRPTWAVSKKGVLYEFDIYIKSIKTLVEYNGRVHYEFVPFFHKTKKRFHDYVNRDNHKKELAYEEGYKLVVVRYDEPLFEDYIINKVEGKIL